MKKIIDGKAYYIPSSLTIEQEHIYCHIIDWKRENITSERGLYKGNEYDAIFPHESAIPTMLFPAIAAKWEEMQNTPFAYKFHKFAGHAVSSQTACVNLFMPILLSKTADEILSKIPGCPSDFERIARDKLFNGFCFEYWGQDIKQGKGLLNDHSIQAGTDADIAIAYYNTKNQLCVWLIEHKLSEKEFTTCGGYKSRANGLKSDCENCTLTSKADNPRQCYYHQKGYKYWDYLNNNIENFLGRTNMTGCPFREGLNQLWRNQLLGFALKENGIYHNVTFSVCHHAKNSMLNKSIEQYRELTNNRPIFTAFTNYDVMKIINSAHTELTAWKKWYEDVYCF